METLSVEKFPSEKCIFTLVHLKTQVRVFLMTVITFFHPF